MKLVKLACRGCGATLQISSSVDELACNYCGTRMLVDRGGGLVSLQLVAAIGDIRTGAVQTAAELALRRLEREKNDCYRKVEALASQRLEDRYAPTDILTDAELAVAESQQTTLEKKSAGLLRFMMKAMGLWALTMLVTGVWAWSTSDGFFNVLGALLGVGIGGLILGSIAMAVIFGISTLATSNPDKHLEDVKAKIGRHHTAVDILEKLAQLEDAKLELANIEAEIVHKMKIVRQNF